MSSDGGHSGKRKDEEEMQGTGVGRKETAEARRNKRRREKKRRKAAEQRKARGGVQAAASGEINRAVEEEQHATGEKAAEDRTASGGNHGKRASASAEGTDPGLQGRQLQRQQLRRDGMASGKERDRGQPATAAAGRART